MANLKGFSMRLVIHMTIVILARVLSSGAFSPALNWAERTAASSVRRLSRTDRSRRLLTSKPAVSSASRVSRRSPIVNKDQSSRQDSRLVTLSTIALPELETLVTSWGHPRFRAAQVWHWIHERGVTEAAQMGNLPQALRRQLEDWTQPQGLELVLEQAARDGTLKRAYRCADGQLIESVLMPYRDGRFTACISSQAGCAQGCVFCATGQMGLARQLTSDEIYEQVALFSAELTRRDKLEQQRRKDGKLDGVDQEKKSHGRQTRLSNVVFMGMGEPLANYRNVMKAVERITKELGIGARKITISTVGIVPNIRKLMLEPYQVRLAVSLHSADDAERSALLPANARFGGLDELMSTLNMYIATTSRRITFEWALIDGQNDSTESARSLGRLIARHGLRRDMVHVNVIPLNPTGGFAGSPSQRHRVDDFCRTLEAEFGVACTPRVRRGIDIDAGCGQLKSKLERKASTSLGSPSTDDDDEYNEQVMTLVKNVGRTLIATGLQKQPVLSMVSDAVDLDDDDFEDPELMDGAATQEAERLIQLVKGTTIDSL